MKKRVVIATDNFLPRIDGIAVFLAEVLPKLGKKYDITVIAPDFGKVKTSDYNLVKIPLSKVRFGDFQVPKFRFDKLACVISKTDIVWTNSIGPISGPSILIARSLGKKVVSFMHSIEWELFSKAVKSLFFKKHIRSLTKALTRFVYNKCNIIMVPSEGVAEVLRHNKILTDTRTVHLGVDTRRFKPPTSKPFSKKKLNFNPDNIIIVYHGRLSHEKNLKTILRAFVRIRASRNNVNLVIVGDGLDEIKTMFKNQRNVMVTGPLNDVVPYLQAADIYVLSSLTETSCLGVMEAMSCGLPVISTPVGYVKDYIDHEKNGFLYPLRNSVMLAKYVELLIKNRSKREKIGKKAREYIVNNFTWDKTVHSIDTVLKEL